MPKRHTVAVYYLGGRTEPFSSQRSYEQWCSQFLEMSLASKAVPVLITPEPNPQGKKHLSSVLRMMKRDWNVHDGFVITLHPSRFLYTANLFSFILGEIGKPVIFTTTTVDDPTYSDTVLKSHMINAVQAATTNCRGTFILAGTQMTPATHTITVQRAHEQSEKFRSADDQIFGYVDFGMQITRSAPPRIDLPLKLHREIEERIQYSTVDTQSHEESITLSRNSREVKGIIIDGGDSLPLSFTQDLPKRIPVLMVSKEGVQLYEQERLVALPRLTRYAAAAKFCWALGQIAARTHPEMKGKRIGEWMDTDFMQELLSPEKKRV